MIVRFSYLGSPYSVDSDSGFVSAVASDNSCPFLGHYVENNEIDGTDVELFMEKYKFTELCDGFLADVVFAEFERRIGLFGDGMTDEARDFLVSSLSDSFLVNSVSFLTSDSLQSTFIDYLSDAYTFCGFYDERREENVCFLCDMSEAEFDYECCDCYKGSFVLDYDFTDVIDIVRSKISEKYGK